MPRSPRTTAKAGCSPRPCAESDYGLGHDERAKVHQPVAGRLGPRFYDWQLAQSAEESWREFHLHARNLLGEEGYRRLLAEIEAEALATKGKEIQQFQDEVDALGKRWREVCGSGTSAGKKPRTPLWAFYHHHPSEVT